MARDPLRSVQLVRTRLVEQARQELGDCLRSEAEITARILALEDAAKRDRTGDQLYLFQEMFTRREQARQVEYSAAQADLTASEACSNLARCAVTAARSAAEAVETFMAERAAAADIEAARRTQHILDDMARSRFRALGVGRLIIQAAEEPVNDPSSQESAR